MVQWVIKRIDTLPPSVPSPLGCHTGSQPAKITLQDIDSGSLATEYACVDPSVQPCDATNGFLKALHDAGYTPADWDTECGF